MGIKVQKHKNKETIRKMKEGGRKEGRKEGKVGRKGGREGGRKRRKKGRFFRCSNFFQSFSYT